MPTRGPLAAKRDREKLPAPPQQIVYVQAYKPGRTDADIIADQKKDQAKREAYAKAKQKQFQKLQKQLGIE